MIEVAAISDLEFVDTDCNNMAFLLDDGKEGPFLVKNSADYTAELAADLTGGIVTQSIFDLDKALVRHWNGAIDPSWWGVSESATGSQNTARMNECLAVAGVCRERNVLARAGRFEFSSSLTRPMFVKLSGQGGHSEKAYPGATQFILDHNSVGISPMGYGLVDGIEFVPGTGYTPTTAVLVSGRNETLGHNGYIGALGCCIDVGTSPANLQFTNILGGYADGVVDGVRVRQYPSSPIWANSTAYTAGTIRHCINTGLEYRCAIAHTSPATGSFITDRINNPTRWAEASNAYGGADDNSGYLGPISIQNATGIGIGFYNTNGWTFNNPKVQNCASYSYLFEHQCRGNKGMIYSENDLTKVPNSIDVYVGTRCHTNEIDVCTLIPSPRISYAPLAKQNNTIRSRYIDANGVISWRVV